MISATTLQKLASFQFKRKSTAKTPLVEPVEQIVPTNGIVTDDEYDEYDDFPIDLYELELLEKALLQGENLSKESVNDSTHSTQVAASPEIDGTTASVVPSADCDSFVNVPSPKSSKALGHDSTQVDAPVDIDSTAASVVPSVEYKLSPGINVPSPPDESLTLDTMVLRALQYLKREHITTINQAIQDSKAYQKLRCSSVSHYSLDIHYNPIDISHLFHVDPSDIEKVQEPFLKAFQILVEKEAGCTFTDHLFIRFYPTFSIVSDESLISWLQNSTSPYRYLDGIVVQLDFPCFVNQSYYYRCTNAKCNNKCILQIVYSNSQFVVYKRDGQGKELGVVSKSSIRSVDLVCHYCSKQMQEQVCDGLQVVQQDFIVHLLNETGLIRECKCIIYNRPHCIKIGDVVRVFGKLVAVQNYDKQPILKPEFEVCDVQVRSIHQNVPVPALSVGDSWFLKSRDISDLFFQDIVPEGTFPLLKLGLLMSLVSVCELDPENSFPIHVLVVQSQRDPLVSRMLTFASQSSRSTRWNSYTSLIKTPKSGFRCFPSIARNGFVIADNTILSRKDTSALQSFMTQKGHSISGKTFEMSLTTNTAVWVTENMRQSFVFEKQSDARKSFLSQFGLVLDTRLLDHCDADIELSIAEFILNNSDGPLNSNELFQYIRSASQISIEVSNEVQTFLTTYVTALRKQRGTQIPKTITQLTKDLINFSKSHCRLCYRDTVILEDGLVAIVMLETTLATMFDCSLLDFNCLSQGVSYLTKLVRQRYPENDENDVNVQFHTLYSALIEEFTRLGV